MRPPLRIRAAAQITSRLIHFVRSSSTPSLVVREILRIALLLPRRANVERLRIDDEDAARPVAVGRAEGVHVDPVGAAVRRVRPRISGALGNFLRLDDLDEPGRAGIAFGVLDVNAR